MDNFSMAEAARRLNCSRQVLYKHVSRDKSRYTVDINGKQHVTLYGMELLQNIIQANKQKPVSTIDAPLTPEPVSRQEHDQLVRELREQMTALEKTVTDLQSKLTESEKKVAMMEGSLQVREADYIRAMETLSRPGIVTAWVRRLFAGKGE